jgi:hypothetical protein
VLETYDQMGKTAEALDNDKVTSLPQSIFVAGSLLIEWIKGQIQCSGLDEIECQQGKSHDRIQDKESKLGQ